MYQYITVTRNDSEVYMRQTILVNLPRLSIGDRLICKHDYIWRVDDIILACDGIERAMNKAELELQSYWSNREDYY